MVKKNRRPPPAHPHAERVHAYARAVVAGEIVTGRYVRMACQRHLDDLERCGMADGRPIENPKSKIENPNGLVWKPARAESALTFFEETLCIKPGLPFKLEPFQAFIVGSLFGWYKREQGTGDRAQGEERRRFRVAYCEMGKGNGKTPLAAGIGLYGLTTDREDAPEIYAAAAAKDQAKICFTDAKRMVRASPELTRIVTVLTNNLSAPGRLAKFTTLSSEDKGHHGLRVHMGLLDEIHAHSSAAVVDTIEAGTKNCRNSLILLITNSGSDRRGPCWAYHARALDMLHGKPDDELFAYVCTLDPCRKCEARGKKQPDPKCRDCDQIETEAVWIKANPGLGTILDRDYLARRVALARKMPSKRNNVLQLNGCLWTETDDGWLDMYAWRNHCLDASLRLEDFAGQPCAIGLDAANRVDATCLALLFELKPGAGTLDPAMLPEAAREAMKEALGAAEESARTPDPAATEDAAGRLDALSARLAAAGYALFLRTYVPAAMVRNSSSANHEAYQLWSQQGHLTVTPGAITDFARILADLQELAGRFVIRRLQADPRELGYLLQKATEFLGADVVVQVGQGATMISQPMKMFEGLVAAGLIKHDGNPVLDWMLGNVVQKQSRSGGPLKYYYPTRPSESQKIDAAPASFMALDGFLRAGEVTAAPGLVMLG